MVLPLYSVVKFVKMMFDELRFRLITVQNRKLRGQYSNEGTTVSAYWFPKKNILRVIKWSKVMKIQPPPRTIAQINLVERLLQSVQRSGEEIDGLSPCSTK